MAFQYDRNDVPFNPVSHWNKKHFKNKQAGERFKEQIGYGYRWKRVDGLGIKKEIDLHELILKKLENATKAI